MLLFFSFFHIVVAVILSIVLLMAWADGEDTILRLQDKHATSRFIVFLIFWPLFALVRFVCRFKFFVVAFFEILEECANVER